MTTTPDYLRDIETLTRTELRKKYLSTYNSWRNTKQRCKNGLYKLHPHFEDFVSFLGHLDTTRVLARLMRRADLEMAHSRGFRPKPLDVGPTPALRSCALPVRR